MEILIRVDEAIQATIFAQYLEGGLPAEAAIERLKLPRSTFFRRLARFRMGGPAALAHGLRGKPSNARHDESIRAAVVKMFRDEYSPHGFGTAHFVELARERFPDAVSYKSVWR